MQSRVVTNAAKMKQHWLGIPGVEVTAKGRVFVTWYGGGGREPAPENTVFLSVSGDGGKRFDPPQAVVQPIGDTRAYDPALWLDPGNRLWLLYNRSSMHTGESSVWATCCTDPDAQTVTWSPPKRIGFEVPFAFRLNKPVALSTGQWAMPVTWSSERSRGWFPHGSEVQGVALSSDRGETWQLHGAVTAPNWALENMVVEKGNGDLAMYIRTGARAIWQSTSTDGGLTWGAAQPTGIANPGSRFFIGRLQSGRWLLINSPNPSARTAIAASLSGDEGQTWSEGLVLDSREQVSYPDAAEGPDGLIYAVHDYDRRGAGEIVLSLFREQEIA